MNIYQSLRFCACLALLLSAGLVSDFGRVYAQSSTATLSGTVVDQSGATVAGAEITAVDPSTGLTRQATTNSEGSYTFPPLPPGTYVVKALRDGFAPVEINNVVLSTGDQQSLKIELRVGSVGDSVTVQADAGQLQIQAESGERSSLITNTQLKDLALNGRNVLGLLRTVPGVTGNASNVSGPGGLDNFHINGTRGNQTELTIDGSSNINNGSNGQLQVTINPDAVEEVKILTSNYQAEYGKAAGGQIQFRTRSGTNRYHGGARFFRRHDSLNANEYFNNTTGQPRPLYRFDYFGWDFGGPVVLPRFGEGGSSFVNGKDKLFFFFNQEFYYHQLRPNAARNLRVPTEAERSGDFSQTTDGNGNRIFLRDPTKTGTCTAANTVANPGACFVTNGRLNVIPAERFFRDGQAILNIYPLPNTAVGAARFNYTSQISQNFPRREDIIRVDWQLSERTRLTGRYLNNPGTQDAPYGGFANVTFNFPLFDYQNQRSAYNAAFTLLHTFSPRVTNEFIFGPSHQLEENDAVSSRPTRARFGLGAPLLFSGALGSELIPTFVYGGIANQTFPTTAILPLPRLFDSTTYNFIDNLTMVAGNHIVKTGVFIQRGTFRAQGGQATNANINFNNDANNPLNTGHPFANALLGIYNTFAQADTVVGGNSLYYNVETYVQDTWKVARRLTLDVGLRMSYLPPQYDRDLRSSVFNPELFNPAKAQRLYTPVLVGTQRRAIDPANRPATLTAQNTLPAAFIGLLVPGSGDAINGLGVVRNGYPKGGFDSRGIQWGPRFGFAYDIFGDASTVVRGGFGISYDRLQYNIVPQIANPLTVQQPQLFYGQLSDLGGASGAIGPPGVTGYARDGKIPNVYSYSLGVQRNLGFSTVLDVAYVGTLGRHLVQARNINAVPYFATFRHESQDPSQYPGGIVPTEEPGLPDAYRQAGFLFTGARALPANFLRPYQGYGAINFREFVGSSNYHALQVSANRRFTRGFTFGIAYTYSKTFVTGDADFENTNPYNTRAYDYRLAEFDLTHVFVANYVLDLSRVSRFLGDNRFARALFDNYQLSGISSFGSGAPYELGFGINGVNTGQRITGSYDLLPSLRLRSDPNRGRDGQNALLVDPNAFALPAIGDIGPYPRTYLRGPFNHNHDVSVFKNFPFGGEGRRYLQLRFEFFNVFNHTRFNAINTGATVSVPSANAADVSGFTIGSAANGNAVVFNDYRRAVITDNLRGLRPTDASQPIGRFFGEYNNAGSPRIIQLAVKLYF